jgi:hypothetical protein
MSFLDRAKAAAGQVRAKAQEGVGEVQLKKELAQAYWDLGHKAHELASAGEISNPQLDPLVQRISELQAREGGHPDSGPGEEFAPPEATTPPDSTA